MAAGAIITERAVRQTVSIPAPSGSGLGLYIHVPFCTHICPYCDFTTYAGQENLIPRYVEAVERDIARQAALIGGRPVETIYLGGGTPSLLTPEQVTRLVAACRAHANVDASAEITLEANPNGIDEARFAGYLQAGVNRLSLGVQTTHRRGLRVLGRLHEAHDAKAAYLAARRAGFTNVSLDLIFGWPGQTLNGWQTDLEEVLDWDDGGPEHLSLYGLIVEPGTPMADAVTRGILTTIDDDAAAEMYEGAIETLNARGYLHYEVANWARSEDVQSRHNRLYWRNADYLGIGAGAHGTLAGQRRLNHLWPATYIEAVESGQPPFSNEELLSPETQMGETMMLGLRLLREGVAADAFAARHGIGLRQRFGATIDELCALGMLAWHDDSIRLTRRGLMLANDVCARFL
jgi:oxygen-independent coproporphyrinogen-3 oxidase